MGARRSNIIKKELMLWAQNNFEKQLNDLFKPIACILSHETLFSGKNKNNKR
jgi:hypothetical protein